MLLRSSKLFILSLFVVSIKARGADYQSIDDITLNIKANSLLPDKSTCGKQTSNKIVGGQGTSPDEFPWLALLQYRLQSGAAVFGGAGSLISDRYVLTAAHCLTGKGIGNATLFNVRLGEWDTTTAKDCQTQANVQSCSDPPLDVPIESLIPHSNYDNTIRSHLNDIGLIRLRNTVKFTNFIRPICLPAAHFRSPVGTGLYVAGWGKTESGDKSPRKLKVQVPIANLQVCLARYRKLNITVVDTQICAGGEKGKDSCGGDSGGPLMRTFSNAPSQWFCEGIVSFGTKCGEEHSPAIYTRVSEYLDWINKNMKR